jgi:hypothetical protein
MERKATSAESAKWWNHGQWLLPVQGFIHRDYNWEPAPGCPSFVSEPRGDGKRGNPEARRDVEARVSNLTRWLLPA